MDENKLRNIAKRCLAIGSCWTDCVEKHPDTAEQSTIQAENELIDILKWTINESAKNSEDIMNPMQAPNVGVGGKDHGGRDKADNRLSSGEAWMYCNDCGAKLYSFDGNKDASRKCPKMRNGECKM